MARITGSACRFCRRAGTKLYLKGEKCMSDKCSVTRRSYPPGQHGRRYIKETEYSVRLREKQKAKQIYGVLEKQFRNYYAKAVREKGVTGDNLLRMLESRLDNVVYRLGLAPARREARQMVTHGLFSVKGRRVDIPSYQVKQGDEIGLTSAGARVFKAKHEAGQAIEGEIAPWLEFDAKKLKAKVKNLPAREEIPVDLKEQLIIEFYSK
ncbi:MAG: 30S ribosomal protein S4 [Actinomycetota bacterium]